MAGFFIRQTLLALLWSVVAVTAAAQPPRPIRIESSDPACRAATLVSTGGMAPRSRDTLAVRWTGFGNFELAYDGQVILLDAWFDRGSLYPPLGFKAADIRKADVILIGHGHYDHMADAAAVATATGARVVGAPLTIAKLREQSVAEQQLRSVNGRGGEVLAFRGFTVEPILARHGEPAAEVTAAFASALQRAAVQPTAAQLAEGAAIAARGIPTSDPRVITEGTLAYLITLDSGFRILFRDSGGRVTDSEKSVAARVGPVDLVLAATSASYVTASIVGQALEYVHTYRPGVFMPAHHDGAANELWRPTEPVFQAIRDENPNVVTISTGYREPTCFRTR